MGTWGYIKGVFSATWSGLKHLFRPRMTLRYPEQKLDLEDSEYPTAPRRPAGLSPGYKYDPVQGVGIAGFKGRHILYFERCTGCQLCAIACDGIAVAIDMQKVTKGKPQNKKDIWPAVDYGRCVFCGFCLDYLQEIQVNPGLKPINQIAIGEHVLTHTGAYKPVTKIWDMSYSGPFYRIHVFGKPEPLACTADHPIVAVSRPVSNRKDKRLLRVNSPLLFYKPSELKPGDYLVSPIVRKVVHTERYEKDVPMYRGGKTTRRLSFEASPDLFRLIGYYYAEGSCDGGRRVNFDFNETERETYAEDCGDLVNKFFEKVAKVRKNGEHGIRLVLNSALAEDFFSQFGKGAPNKKLPGWVFFAEPDKQLELLKGEWQGDGCRVKQARQKYLNITTTSKTLAFQLQSVYARLGIVATIDSEQSRRRLRSYHVNVFGKWAIKLAKMWNVEFDYKPTKHADKFHIDDHYVYMPIRRIEVEEVKDHHVMDVTVEDDHTFAPLGLATSNCIDACPFDALYMTNDYELSAYDKMGLKYTPDMLAVPPKLEGKKYKVEFDTEKGVVKYG
ncbi:MAG TPA: LAGLIDADG family homing endonuclease [Nitrososphaerales archaeon]|nr:LAGLIDADG family homing endonuclease [Nitrososphaerales archaeon]